MVVLLPADFRYLFLFPEIPKNQNIQIFLKVWRKNPEDIASNPKKSLVALFVLKIMPSGLFVTKRRAGIGHVYRREWLIENGFDNDNEDDGNTDDKAVFDNGQMDVNGVDEVKTIFTQVKGGPLLQHSTHPRALWWLLHTWLLSSSNVIFKAWLFIKDLQRLHFV